MSELVSGRRGLLVLASAAGLGLAFAGPATAKEKEKKVGAVEDLMREHGVIRRALLAMWESAPALRAGASNVDPSALNCAAKLFRTFGEDYHERAVEEAYI